MKQILSIPSQFGPLLQSARKSAGMSQTTLAKRLGISQSRLSAMELDPASINLEQLLTLVAALNLEISVQSRKSPGESASATRPEW